jgi:hypothetical protein
MVIRVLELAAIGGAVMISAAVGFHSPGEPVTGSAGSEGGDPPSAGPARSGGPAAETSPVAPLDGLLAWAGDPDAIGLGPGTPEPPGEAARRRLGKGVGPARQRGRDLSPKLVAQCLEVAQEVDPVLADRLAALRRQSDDRAFARAIRNARHLVGLAGLKERHPQLYEVKVQELRLDAQVTAVLAELAEARRASSAAADELEAELRELVRHQVAYSITARGMYLLRLQENIKSLRDQLAHDSANFENTVDRRMRRLLEDAGPHSADERSPAPAG